MDEFAGHPFGAHWGTTVTGYSAVIRRYVKDGLTVILLANLDDGAFGIDAMSKRIADMYVPGVAIQGLAPVAEIDGRETARLRTAIAAIAAGADSPDAVTGLAARMPEAVRNRIAATLGEATAFEYLGEERVTDGHFNPDPALARNRWYRATTAAGMRYVTVRLTAESRVAGVAIEDQ
jgi:hypothetical protein